MRFFIIILILQGWFNPCLKGQSDLLSLIEDNTEPAVHITEATFKGSRLINGHTIMSRKKGTLEFLISHRFGRINAGLYELFGLDDANVRFGLDYGITDQLTVGLGRNSFEKTYDGFVKYAILRQQTGVRSIPISVTLFGSGAINTLQSLGDDPPSVTDRMSYTAQALIARKFNSAISFQLMPTFVHFNRVIAPRENDLLALGLGGRMKLSQRMSINLEYYYRLQERDLESVHDALAIGVDLETGGHVFQFQFTNSRAMNEKGFIRETTGNVLDGDIHFGFNITRSF